MSTTGRKARHQEAIRERAREARRALYHNAKRGHRTGREDQDAERAWFWFQDIVEQEIDYLRDGGAYGLDYRRTLEHPSNSGKFTSERARKFYIASGMRKMREEREDCGALTGWDTL